MTSFPKNVQFTNVKINSEQDLFQISPSIPSPSSSDDSIFNELCANQCIPSLDLIPPCNNILAALKVKGSVSICKGLAIGNTNAEIQGTIRFNGKNFEGFNGQNWVLLDCCDSLSDNCFASSIDSSSVSAIGPVLSPPSNFVSFSLDDNCFKVWGNFSTPVPIPSLSFTYQLSLPDDFLIQFGNRIYQSNSGIVCASSGTTTVITCGNAYLYPYEGPVTSIIMVFGEIVSLSFCNFTISGMFV